MEKFKFIKKRYFTCDCCKNKIHPNLQIRKCLFCGKDVCSKCSFLLSKNVQERGTGTLVHIGRLCKHCKKQLKKAIKRKKKGEEENG